MNLRVDYLEMAGIDPMQPPAESLAVFFRSYPLRQGPDEGSSIEEIMDRGWCAGIEETSRLMEALTGMTPGFGTAFDCSWPWARIDGAVVAPALPIRLLSREEEGPDGMYRLEEMKVFREAAGEERDFLDLEIEGAGKAPPFDLLCFGAMERFVLSGSDLVIEDLFCRLRTRVSRAELDRILVRGLRLEPSVLEGLSILADLEDDQEASILEISRVVDTGKGFPLDPEVVMGARADVSSVRLSGDRMLVETERGESAVFTVTGKPRSWSLQLLEGSYPLRRLRLQLRDSCVDLEVQPSAELNLLYPGKRGRLAFDLHSDLMTLGL